MANPNASGTAYTAIATLVQVFGEEEAFKLLKAMHKNISNYSRQGVGPIKATARGENLVAVAFIHDVVTEAQAGFPVKSVAPCEGTGYEIGSMSIIKGARNLDNAKKFVRLGADARRRRRWPRRRSSSSCRRTSARPISPLSPKPAEIKLINYDFAKYGASAERKRLLERWDREVGSSRRNEAACDRATRLRARDRATARDLRVAAAVLCRRAAAAQGTLNLYCSSPNTAWCQGMAVGFEKATGVKVAVIQKATGEMFAQIKAERANPKGDIWWAGAARRVPAGRRGRAARDISLAQPRAAARLGAARSAEMSQYRVAGVYGGILALGYNTELARQGKLPVPKCWKDLLDPVYKGEVMLGNPELVGHGLPDAGDAGAGVRRGRGVRVHEGAQRQRQSVRALGHRPDDGGQARRDRTSAARCCTA